MYTKGEAGCQTITATSDARVSGSKWWAPLVFFLLVFLHYSASSQQTYYVDDVSGSDESLGTSPSFAWRTVSKVNAARFKPGDQVLFSRDGLWHEQLVINSSGSSLAPIMVGNYGSGALPLFDPTNSVGPGWIASGSEYAIHLSQSPNTVFLEGALIGEGAGIGMLDPNEWFYDASSQSLYIRLNDGVNPNLVSIEWCRQEPAIYINHASYVIINGVRVSVPWDEGTNPPTTQGGAGVRVLGGHDVQVRQCIITGSKDFNTTGIHVVDCPNFVIDGCQISHTGYGIFLQATSSGFPGVVQNCLIYSLNNGPISDWDGIKATGPNDPDFTGLVLRGNDISHCSEDAIDIYYCRNVLVEMNYLHDSDTIKMSDNQQGVKSIRSGNIIRYNHIENISTPGSTRTGIVSGGDSTQIYYNTIIHCGSYGIVVTGSKGSRIFNNTILDCPTAIQIQNGSILQLNNNIADRGFSAGSGDWDLDIDGSGSVVHGGHNLLVRSSGPNITNSAVYVGNELDIHNLDPRFVIPQSHTNSTWTNVAPMIFESAFPAEPWYVSFGGLSGSRKSTVVDLKADRDWCWGAGKIYIRLATIPNKNVAIAALADFYGCFALRDSSPCVGAGIDVGLRRDYIGTAVPQPQGFDIGSMEETPLPAPTILTPLSGEVVQTLPIQASWVHAGTYFSSYRLQVAMDPMFGSTLAIDTIIESASTDLLSLRSPGVYYLRVQGIGPTGASVYSMVSFDLPSVISGSASGRKIPQDYRLFQNYPNPFNPSTTFEFDLPRAGLTTLKIYDTSGAEICQLVSAFLSPGTYRFKWRAQDIASGIYFYRLVSGHYSETRKLLLLK